MHDTKNLYKLHNNLYVPPNCSAKFLAHKTRPHTATSLKSKNALTAETQRQKLSPH